MLTLSMLLLMAFAVMGLLPDLPVARGLRRWLVEEPARTLNRLTMWRTAFYCGLVVVGIVMTILFKVEGLLVYGMMVPEIMTWAVMFDVAVLIDAVLITVAVMAAQGIRVARMQASAFISDVGSRIVRIAARARRPRRIVRPGRKAAGEDGPGWLAQLPYRAFSMA